MVFHKFGKGVTIHILDGNPEQISVEPLSFIVVDGIQVVYETINFINPEQFTVAVSKYDDMYLAQRFIEYFKLLSKDATTPKLLGPVR
jgi:hypothetical protein